MNDSKNGMAGNCESAGAIYPELNLPPAELHIKKEPGGQNG